MGIAIFLIKHKKPDPRQPIPGKALPRTFELLRFTAQASPALATCGFSFLNKDLSFSHLDCVFQGSICLAVRLGGSHRPRISIGIMTTRISRRNSCDVTLTINVTLPPRKNAPMPNRARRMKSGRVWPGDGA